MFLHNWINKRKNIFAITLFLYLCIPWILSCPCIHAQNAEKRTDEISPGKIELTVKPEDIEKARIKAKEVKAAAEKSISELESLIPNLERDKKAVTVYVTELEQKKEAHQTREVNPAFLKMLDKEIKIVRQKIKLDEDQIQEYREQISALQAQIKVYTDHVVLLESIGKLEEIISVTPYDHAPTIRKEADIAKGYIPVEQAKLKEKETALSLLTKEIEKAKASAADKERKLIEEIESLKKELTDNEIVSAAEEKIKSILFWQKRVQDKRISILETRLKTARIDYESAQQELKNMKLNAALLTEKANRLEEKLRTEELRKKQAEVEAAKKAEEITEKVAEIKKAETEKILQEAAKKGEEVARKQLITTSPEKKRVLELESDVHKFTALVAKKKDELITEGTQRYKDFTEFKKLERDIGVFLETGGTTDEIDEFLKKIESEIKRYSEGISLLESLIASVKEEEKLVSENLVGAKKELSDVEKEVAAFEDKGLARQAREYGRQKVELLEKERELILGRLDRLYERLEIKSNAIPLLQKTREELIEMKAANVWSRVKSSVSAQTFIAIYNDLTGLYSQLDGFYSAALDNARRLVVNLPEKMYTLNFWIRVCGLIALLAVFYFSKKIIRRQYDDNIQILYESEGESYYKCRLLPSLLIVFKKSINAIWLAILSVSVPVILQIETPVAVATAYVLIFIAVYKILQGLLVESFGPEKGDKKLVTSLAYISPTHLYKSLKLILLFSLILLSMIAVLRVFAYRTDVIELLWFIYRVGLLILLLWLATQKTLLFKLLPSAESQFGKLIHRIIKIIYPVFIGFVVSLFAIRSLGYTVLTYVLLKTCIKSFIIAFIAFWIWKFLHNRLRYIREVQRIKAAIKEGTLEEKKFHTVTTVYYASFNYVISIIAAIIIIKVWVRTFRYAIGSPAAPYLVQKIFGQIGTILGIIINGMSYRFVFEEGRYTTPLKIIIGLVVIVVSFFVARYIKRLLEEKVFEKLRFERGLKQTFSTLTRYIIIGIAVLIGLNLAGIPLRSLAFFAGAFGIGIGFGMQNIISNFVSGIILLFERPISIGDLIVLEDGTLGTVEKISARSTTIVTPDAITLTIPNSKFVEGKVTNWSQPDSKLRGSVTVGVAYGSDVNLVKRCLLEIARQNDKVRMFPEPFVRFDQFGDSALIFKLFYWSDDAATRWFAMSELHFAIDEVFRKNNIEIAFPQRDIHVRSVVPFPIQNIREKDEQEAQQGIYTKKPDA